MGWMRCAASEETPAAPSLEELSQWTDITFAPSDNAGPKSSELGKAMPVATKGLLLNVHRHYLDLFDPKNCRHPMVKQSRGMLDMEEGGTYLAAGVLGMLLVIPELDALVVGAEIRGRDVSARDRG